MKTRSKNIDKLPSKNFGRSPVTALQSWVVQPSINNCPTVSRPPMKSKNTFPMLQPSVDLRLKFIHTCGQYFTTDTMTFTSAKHCKYVSHVIAPSAVVQISTVAPAAATAKTARAEHTAMRNNRSALSRGG